MTSEFLTPDYVDKEYLTIDQIAFNFGWSVPYIQDLVRGERLPGLEIDGVWHFRQDEVIDWLGQKIQTLLTEVDTFEADEMPDHSGRKSRTLDTSRVLQLERRVEQSLVSDGTYLRPVAFDRIASRMPLEGISLDAHIADKTGVLRKLVTLADSTGLLYDRDSLLASLLEREVLCSTAMPGGIALCHPRRPIPNAISTQFVCFLKTADPVGFGAEDGEGTSVFFLLCAPDDRSHLYGLARVARIIHNGALDKLKAAKSAQEVKAIITRAENDISTATP
jgi:nitrogen PTS system EIIA component